MTRFRHDLILRMIKLLDAVLVTIPFAMCWYLYYAKRVASPYYAKGDYLVVALFFVLFIIFGRVYYRAAVVTGLPAAGIVARAGRCAVTGNARIHPCTGQFFLIWHYLSTSSSWS